MEILFLTLAVLISAIFAIAYKQKQNKRMYAIFKPLTTVLIIVIALIIHDKTASIYSQLMIVALLFSLIGDVFLLNKKYFLHGLLAFLIAHVCFTLAFTSPFGFQWKGITLVPLVLIAGVYYNYLRKELKKYSIPVFVYMTVLVIMNWQAINLYISSGEIHFLALAIGSIVFSFSDSVLAFNKFKKPFKSAEILILSSYWISIWIFTIVGFYVN